MTCFSIFSLLSNRGTAGTPSRLSHPGDHDVSPQRTVGGRCDIEDLHRRAVRERRENQTIGPCADIEHRGLRAATATVSLFFISILSAGLSHQAAGCGPVGDGASARAEVIVAARLAPTVTVSLRPHRPHLPLEPTRARTPVSTKSRTSDACQRALSMQRAPDSAAIPAKSITGSSDTLSARSRLVRSRQRFARLRHPKAAESDLGTATRASSTARAAARRFHVGGAPPEAPRTPPRGLRLLPHNCMRSSA